MCVLSDFAAKKQKNYVKQATNLLVFFEIMIAYSIYIMYNYMIAMYLK